MCACNKPVQKRVTSEEAQALIMQVAQAAQAAQAQSNK